MRIWLFFVLCLPIFSDISRYFYQEEPNQSQHPILGLASGAELLRPFQYIVEVTDNPPFVDRDGLVEVVFYNQFGQLLNQGIIAHRPFNSTTEAQQIVKSPNLPMLEGRTQLLSWVRMADGRIIRFTFTAPGPASLGSPINNGQITCVQSGIIPCVITFNPPVGTAFSVAGISNVPFPVGQNLVAGTSITAVGATGTVTVAGTSGPSTWFFGPHVFQQGSAAGDFIFIDSDQGPPETFIDFFECQGTPVCVGSPLVKETPKANLSLPSSRFRYEVVFNKQDIIDALRPVAPVPLILRYNGRVLSNPGLFVNPDGSFGHPSAQPKPEANAFLDSYLLPIRFTSVIAPEASRKTTGTGPYAIGIQAGTPGIPQLVYPVQFSTFPYGSPIYPSETPFPTAYPFGPSLSPGRYQTIAYNFTGMVDGDYEIFVTADDFLAAFTNNGQSAGAVTASGARMPGLTTIIQVIRDGVPPNTFDVATIPRVRTLILGDQEEPPLPYRVYQGEIFQILGSVSDERQDESTVEFDLRLDDGTLIVTPGKNGHFEESRTLGGSFSRLFDFTPQDPSSSNSPIVSHQATGGQRAYQMLVYPVDPQNNTAETTKAIYIIKDLQAPADPVLLSPAPTTNILTQSTLNVKVECPNLNPAVIAPFLDLREHGIVTMELLVIDESGTAVKFTTAGLGVFTTGPQISSNLDDSLLWNLAPNPLGGLGLTGVNFFGDLPDKFTFEQRINLDGFRDGLMTFIVRLYDQVGNPSALTTSVQIRKDTTGPIIVIGDTERERSGPDDNYPVPNQFGADDDTYLISNLSPELTLDSGSAGPIPLIPDPGTKDRIHLDGVVVDGISRVDRVELRSAHIALQTTALSSLNVVSATFFLEADLQGVPEGIKEVIDLRGFDNNGIAGPIRSVSLFRDTTPADKPVIEIPPQLPFTSRRVVYTSESSLRIKGSLAAKDSNLINLPDNTTLRGKVVILTPPTNPTAFTTGQNVIRLPKTAPNQVPRLDSFYSTFPSTALTATFHYIEAKDDGGFDFPISLTHFPQSATVATTIWVQAIDSLENTDPEVSAFPIDIFYFPGGAPVATLTLKNFRQKNQDIVVFPPASLPSSQLLTLFTGLEKVDFRLNTFVPMIVAPDLILTQFGASPKTATLLSSVDKVLGTTIFEYAYSVLETRGRFDGQVKAEISGGKDIFGNSILKSLVSTVFYVDSLSPNRITTAPNFVVQDVQPSFQPRQGQRINVQGIQLLADVDDFLPSNGSFDRSGIDTGAFRLTLNGPLGTSPENSIALNVLTTPPAGFDTGALVVGNLIDGTYRIRLLTADKVGNTGEFFSSFVFDTTPVAPPLIFTEPQDKSIIASLPLSQTSQILDLYVEKLDADLTKSDFSLVSPEGLNLSLGSTTVVDSGRIRKALVQPLIYDGSLDGTYQIPIQIRDLAGNPIQTTHSFLLDSKSPKVLSFFPASGTCVGGNQSVFDVQIQDQPGRLDLPIPVAGMSSLSRLNLFYAEGSGPSITLATGILAGENRIFSETNQPDRQKIVFLPTIDQTPQNLPADGTGDGRYLLEAIAVDGALNTTRVTSEFFYDSQAPVIALKDFSELKQIPLTLSFPLDLEGVISDSGPCHFFVGSAAANAQTTLELEVYTWLQDTKEKGVLVLKETIEAQRLTSPVFNYHSAQARFSYSKAINSVSIGQTFLLELKTRDQVGNQGLTSRLFQLVAPENAAPIILEPPAFSQSGNVLTTYHVKQPQIQVRWSVTTGVQTIEMEIYRLSVSSTQPMLAKTYLAKVNHSEVISLNTSPALSGVELFRLDLRGKDPFGRATKDAPPRFFLTDLRSFALSDVFISHGSKGYFVSQPGNYLSTPEFQIRADFPRPLALKKGQIRLQFRSGYPEVTLSEPLIEGLTSSFSVQAKLSLNAAKPQIREKPVLIVEGFQDQREIQMQPFSTSLPVDFGPDTDLRIFQNPISRKEKIAVVRFISQSGRLEPVPVRYNQGRIISPSMVLIKSPAIQDLSVVAATPTSSFQADTFTAPLPFQSGDQGFFVLQIRYQDILGKNLLQEKEISLGALSASKGLVSHQGQYSITLSGSEIMQGLLCPDWSKPSIQSEGWQFVAHLPSFDLLQAKSDQEFLLQGIPKTLMSTHLVLVAESEGSWQALSRVMEPEQSFRIKNGMNYMLAEDQRNPQILWAEGRVLHSGWQDLPLILQDQESGIDWSSLTIRDQKGRELVLRESQGRRQVRLDRDVSVLEAEVLDLSGRKAAISKAVQILPDGVYTVDAFPNPVRQAPLRVRTIVTGALRLTYTVYDTSGRSLLLASSEAVGGENIWNWDLNDRLGRQVANGIYLIRVRIEMADKALVRQLKVAVLR